MVQLSLNISLSDFVFAFISSNIQDPESTQLIMQTIFVQSV